MPKPKKVSTLHRPLTNPATLDVVIDAVRQYELTSPDWSRPFGCQATIDEIEVFRKEIVQTEAGGFSASARAYARLGDRNEDGVAFSFAIQASGRFVNEDGQAKAFVDSVEVDTSSYDL